VKCTRPNFFNGSIVPCGMCMACRVNKTRQWSLRLMHEASYHDFNVFTTLTYDDEHLPPNGTLVKRDLQLYLKRLRRDLEPKRIKFYAVGEYGELFSRPHYHIIIFGLPYDSVHIADNWEFGMVKSLPYLGLATGNYVAGYVQKKLYGKGAVEYENRGVIPPFSLMSKGLGLQFLKDNADRIKKDLYLTVNGIPNSVPRYYRNKLGIKAEDFKDVVLADRHKMVEFHLVRMTGDEMARFLRPAVTRQRVEKYLNGELDEDNEWLLFQHLVGERVLESRKQSERNSLAQIRDAKKGVF